MASRKSFYLNSEGPRPESIAVAFEWLVRICKNSGGGQQCFLLVNTLSNLDGAVETILGVQPTKSLKKGHSLSLPGDAGTLTAYSERTLRNASLKGNAIVLFPTKSFLDAVDSMIGLESVLVVPYAEKEVAQWIATWEATEILGNPFFLNTPISDRALREALDRIDTVVNVSTGLAHPSDKDHANRILKQAKRNDATMDHGAARAYLIGKKGWKPRHADSVAKIVKRLER
jgi:hypothetical protein